MISPSLSKSLDWVQVLTLLGEQPNSAVLPYHTKCLLCGGSAHVVYDILCSSHWFYCDGCGRCGGLIELAADVWQISLEAAIAKLASLRVLVFPGDPAKNTQDYVHYFAERHRRFLTFWESARVKLSADDSIPLRALQHKLGLRTGLDRERWLNGPGQFIGGEQRKPIELCYQPGLRDDTWIHSSHRLFLGGDWSEVLMIPSWDLPGRIKGYYFVGRDGRVPEDTSVRSVKYHEYDREVGLFLLPAARRRPEYGDAVLVLPDPLLALRLHVRHFQDNSDTLPVVACWDDNKCNTAHHVWGIIPPGPTVFWGPPANLINTIKHARNANGYVLEAAWPGDGKAWGRRLPSEWVRMAQTDAVHWEVALERALTSLPCNRGEELVIAAGVTPTEIGRVLALSPPETRERYFNFHGSWRVVKDGKDEIIENDRGWVNAKTNHLLSDAVLRVERAVRHPKERKLYYDGYILYRGRKVQFYEPASVVHGDIRAWMRETIVKAGHGFPIIKNDQSLFELATLFHQPEPCSGFDHTGWDNDRGCFVMPGYLIKPGGAVEISAAAQAAAPGVHLPEPTGLSRTDILALSADTPAVCLVWTAVGCVVAALLAPLSSNKPVGCAVSGHGFKTLAGICELLGCAVYDPDNHPAHWWPAVVSKQTEANCVHAGSDLFHTLVTPNVIMPVSWYAGQVLRCRKGWNVLRVDDHTKIRQELMLVVPKIIPNFLHHLSLQNFHLTKPAHNHNALAWELQNWFDSLGGNTEIVRTSLAHVDGYTHRQRPGQVVESFFAILCALYTDGYLVTARPGFEARHAARLTNVLTCRLVLLKDKLFVPKTGVNEGLWQNHAPPLDNPAVSAALNAAGILRGEGDMEDRAGWFIDDDYWTRRMLDWQERQPRGGRQNVRD